jgi:hypothetical protein
MQNLKPIELIKESSNEFNTTNTLGYSKEFLDAIRNSKF